MEQLPVTPAVLTWARERAGIESEEIAKKFARFAEWENGKSSPTYPQLEQISEALKIPVAVFFFPEPPRVPPIEETFRTLPSTEYKKLPSRIKLLLRKAKALQLNLYELAQTNPAQKLITKGLSFPLSINLEDMANSVRDYLGVSIETQLGWKDDETALEEWRAALLRVGIFIFKDAFKTEGYSGFCLYDEAFPIIYVNNSCAKTRQIFTYFHELAHLLFHTSGIDSLNDQYISRLKDDAQKVEILCNKFAAQFLLPDKVFASLIAGQETTEATAEWIAAKFHVSREVVFRKFLDRGLVSEEQYLDAVDRWNNQRTKGKSGGNPYWTQLAYLGRPYVSLALKQYHQNKINEGQLAEYLNTKPKFVSTLESYFERGNG